MYAKQRTLLKPVYFSGVGVHSGKKVNLTIKPGPANLGIQFRRVDLPAQPTIKAHFNKVVDTSLATVIGEGGVIVSTIEHLMSCLAGLSVDNAIVEMDDYETPIMDGSGAEFAEAIIKAGIAEQNAPRIYFVVTSPIELHEDGKSVGLYPASHFKITCTIDFAHPLIKTQTYSIDLTPERFLSDICRARTFGFLQELEYMQFYGLAKGGSLDNAVILDDKGVINTEGLRYPNEFVRHKILDCIGDFSLLGMPVLGHAMLYKSGHQFNHKFLEKFFASKSSWETLTFEGVERLSKDRPETAAR